MVVMILPDEEYGDGGKWTVIEEIGDGSFGEIWRVREKESGQVAAMKATDKQGAIVEAHCLNALVYCGYAPSLLDSFPVDLKDKNRGIVMTLGSADLLSLRNENGNGVFAKKTTLAIGFHLFSALESIHSKNIIHQDIKEANLLMKIDPHKMTSQPFFVIDFGCAIPYDNPEITPVETKFGASRYHSPNICNKKPPSKRDDCTMSLYVLLLERGRDDFSDYYSGFTNRKNFELFPERFVNPGDEWISNCAKIVFSNAHNVNPDYKAILNVIETSETGFNPKEFIFELKENEKGKKFLL